MVSLLQGPGGAHLNAEGIHVKMENLTKRWKHLHSLATERLGVGQKDLWVWVQEGGAGVGVGRRGWCGCRRRGWCGCRKKRHCAVGLSKHCKIRS